MDMLTVFTVPALVLGAGLGGSSVAVAAAALIVVVTIVLVFVMVLRSNGSGRRAASGLAMMPNGRRSASRRTRPTARGSALVLVTGDASAELGRRAGDAGHAQHGKHARWWPIRARRLGPTGFCRPFQCESSRAGTAAAMGCAESAASLG